MFPETVNGAAARVKDNNGDDTKSMGVIRGLYHGLQDEWKSQGMSPRQISAMLLSTASGIYTSTLKVRAISTMFSTEDTWSSDPRKRFCEKANTESWETFKQQLRATVPADRKAVNIHNAHAQTALMWAAIQGDVELAKWLVEQGADIKAKDADGKTALMLAQEMRREDIADLLKNAEAKAQ